MAYSRLIFNTQTLAIMNMLDPGETLEYDWSIDEDYSIVLVEGSVSINDTTLEGVQEYRIQPNENLSVTGAGNKRSVFISLFRVDNDEIIDQIVSSDAKNKMKIFSPEWFEEGQPSNPDTSREPNFSAGNHVFTKSIINEQIMQSEWN